MHADICAVVLAGSHPSQAATLLGAADAERDRTGLVRTAVEQDLVHSGLELAGVSDHSEQWTHHYQLGLAKTLEEVFSDIAR